MGVFAKQPANCYNKIMEEEQLPKRNLGGRPRKYHTPEEAAAAREARRKELYAIKRGLAPGLEASAPAPIAPPAERPLPQGTQAAIAEATAKLSIVDAAFVLGLASGLSPSEALARANPRLAVKSAKTMGAKKLRNSQDLQKAVGAVKAALAVKAQYDFDEFIAELDRAVEFATRTNNATAYVRAVELKGKSTGHLADRPAGNAGSGFTLNIVGLDVPANATVERLDE